MTIDDYAEIVKNGRHLIDLRAPVEFAKGSFPDTVNLPLMDDREREMVGTEYKERKRGCTGSGALPRKRSQERGEDTKVGGGDREETR